MVHSCLVILLFMSTSLAALAAQQTIYWKKDHIYNGPGGKEIATLTPVPSDQIPPSAPTGLGYSSLTATSVQLSWLASTDTGGSGLAGYKVYRQLAPYAPLPVGTVAAGVLSFVDQPLKAAQGYTYTIVAFDTAQNHSSPSSSIALTTLSSAGDTLAPTTPQNLQGRALSSTSTRLEWYASTDSGGAGLAGYHVYRGGVLISGGTPLPQLFFQDSGLTANTTYAYTVKAVDNNSNASSLTGAVNVTTNRTLLFQDNFNRSNAASLGSPWTTALGSVQVFQNSAYIPAPATQYSIEYSGDAIQSNQTSFKASITLSQVSGANARAGIVFYRRFDTSSGPPYYNVGYRALFDQGYVKLYRFNDIDNISEWSGTLLASATAGASVPFTLSVDTNPGDGTVRVWVNGSLRITSIIPTGVNMTGGVGITAATWRDCCSTFHEAKLDNFLLEQ